MKTKKELLAELLDIALTIQEKGIATIFFDVSGHVDTVDVKLFAPKWEGQDEPTFRVDYIHTTDRKALNKAIDELKFIAENGIESIPGYKEKQAEVLKQKRAQLKKLQAELAA